MTVSLKPLRMPVEAFSSLSLKPSRWTFIRSAPGYTFSYPRVDIYITTLKKVTLALKLNLFIPDKIFKAELRHGNVLYRYLSRFYK